MEGNGALAGPQAEQTSFAEALEPIRNYGQQWEERYQDILDGPSSMLKQGA